MKETCGDSRHLGDQYMERLLYREEARNTGSVSNGKRKVRMSLGEETVGPDEWMRALGSMRPLQSIGVRVIATGEMPEAGGIQWGKQDVAATRACCCLDLPLREKHFEEYGWLPASTSCTFDTQRSFHINTRLSVGCSQPVSEHSIGSRGGPSPPSTGPLTGSLPRFSPSCSAVRVLPAQVFPSFPLSSQFSHLHQDRGFFPLISAPCPLYTPQNFLPISQLLI